MSDIEQHSLKHIARILRKGMTRQERKLWYEFFHRLPITVNRQKQIGGYIVDFFISSARIAVELDGSQHYSPEAKRKDMERDLYLNGQGILVLRYSNYDVTTNFEGVCLDILNHINARSTANIDMQQLKPL